MADDNTPWLHIRGQFTYHSEATIRGTAHGLTALRDAIDGAILTGKGECDVFATDGEGYGVIVTRGRTLDSLGRTTYADEDARNLAAQERDYLVRESKIIMKQNKEALDALTWCRANGDLHLTATPSTDIGDEG